MKLIFPFFLVLSTMAMNFSLKAEIVPPIKCNASTINNVYIPILREVVDWPDEMIRPYAKELCNLEKEKQSLQKSISLRATEIRTSNWRVCKEVIPGNPNPTSAECAAAHNGKINSLIDQCIALINIGHNPHNVMLIIDPVKVEVSCLRGVDLALK